MPGEAELIRSANGDFNLILLAVVVLALLSGFFYMLKNIMEQNTKNNALIIEKLDKIVEKVGEYQKQTADIFCSRLEKHDLQAKVILDLQKETKTILENRPCINGDSHR
ncbi:hypothetical protein M0R72_11060 [Candidatus Pacearchaeota archaeon]|jgi:hypothetical protein|nr:hypothetical protein [Candidatus Pacearchaeota archaeon]